MKLSNFFMVAARGICNISFNPEMVLETMKHTMFQSLRLVRCRHVFDLFSRLCRMKIGTNAVKNNCRYHGFVYGPRGVTGVTHMAKLPYDFFDR